MHAGFLLFCKNMPQNRGPSATVGLPLLNVVGSGTAERASEAGADCGLEGCADGSRSTAPVLKYYQPKTRLRNTGFSKCGIKILNKILLHGRIEQLSVECESEGNDVRLKCL